jgi:YbgC/YbaW family acyl-CoA thioester hydrolase
MARIEIQLPEKFIFKTDITVRVSDLNYANHVGNDNILSLMQEARALFYRSMGYESEIKLAGTIGLIITDASIVYKAESILGDVITIQIGLGDPNKYGFDLFYLITRDKDKKVVAKGKTGSICFDYEKKKVVSIPTSLMEKLRVLVPDLF